VGVKRKKHYVIGMCDVRAFYDNADPPGVTARLDPKSGLLDFGIKLSKSETSDFDAIQYPWSLVARSPGQSPDQVGGGDDRAEIGFFVTMGQGRHGKFIS